MNLTRAAAPLPAPSFYSPLSSSNINRGRGGISRISSDTTTHLHFLVTKGCAPWTAHLRNAPTILHSGSAPRVSLLLPVTTWLPRAPANFFPVAAQILTGGYQWLVVPVPDFAAIHQPTCGSSMTPLLVAQQRKSSSSLDDPRHSTPGVFAVAGDTQWPSVQWISQASNFNRGNDDFQTHLGRGRAQVFPQWLRVK